MSKVKFNLESLKGLIERQYLTEHEANSLKNHILFFFEFETNYIFAVIARLIYYILKNNLKSHLDLAMIMMIF